MDPKTVSITSVTIINTLSFTTMYIRRWWKSKYIMISHIVNHYIPYNKLIKKNHKQYIFEILSKKLPKFGQKGPFFNIPKIWKRHFFRLQRQDLVQKNYQIIKNRLWKKHEKSPFLAILGQNGQFWTVFGQNGQNGIFQKSAWNIFVALTSPN